MRMIDADKLELKETVRIQLCGLKEYVALYSYTKEQIEEAPTVKAITVEWIDGYIKRRANDAEIYAEILFISDMVKEWEKENGRSE